MAFDYEYVCTGCTNYGISPWGFDEVVEHMRGAHSNYDWIRRPNVIDNHGHLWYCFRCKGKSAQDHRSYDSGRAMWNHIRDQHNDALEGGYPKRVDGAAGEGKS